MKKLRIGLIGCGAISTIHAEAIRKSSHAQLSVVCDIEIERAQRLASLYGCDYTTDYHHILDRQDVDVIHILLPHHLHFEVAKSSLLAGKHCLIEKPVTTSLKDLLELMDLEKKTGLKSVVCFQNRLNVTSQTIKTIIDSNQYGKLLGITGQVTWTRDANYYATAPWRGKWETAGGGALTNQSIHTLDLIQWYGGQVEAISGHYGTYYLKGIIEVEDTAIIYLKFKDGVRGSLYAMNNHVTNSPVQLELVFEKGVLILNDGVLYERHNHKETILAEDLIATGEKAYWGLSHECLIDQFYESIRQDLPVSVPLQEAAVTVSILEAFYQHANEGNWIPINI